VLSTGASLYNPTCRTMKYSVQLWLTWREQEFHRRPGPRQDQWGHEAKRRSNSGRQHKRTFAPLETRLDACRVPRLVPCWEPVAHPGLAVSRLQSERSVRTLQVLGCSQTHLHHLLRKTDIETGSSTHSAEAKLEHTRAESCRSGSCLLPAPPLVSQ
jgi:hypothetical protein